MKFEKIDFESMYIDIFKLDEGIYATIFNQDMGSSSNAGFFDLGNITVIFDTLMDPFSTEDLIKASKEITNKEPFLLINSHWHLDHVFGNHLFPNSMPIISSFGTFNQFQHALPERLNGFKERAQEELKKTEEILKKEKDPKKIIEYKNDLITYQKVQEPNFTLRPPDVVISNNMKIVGTERSVEIVNVGKAHSYDDIIAYFPKERICFMGDLLFTNLDPEWAKGINGTPWAADPLNFKKVLESYLEKNIKVYVPGHGTLCTEKEIKDSIEFLDKYFIKKKF
jgi:glyoxylase-like metal-dependent hydrolase (beta-lactamase superfamily II)